MSSTDDQGQGQDQFNDPTAPVPEAPLTPPYSSGPVGGEEPPSPYPTQPPAYGQDPYAQQPPPTYGQDPWTQHPPPTYGQDPYAQQPPPAFGQPGYGSYAPVPGAYGAPQRNGSALTLTILSGISILCCGGIFSIPALVFGIIGLNKQSSDPVESARMTKYGWIAFAVAIALLLVVAGVLIAIGIAGGFDSSSTYEGY